jgi:quercetin dioxygenase-like cupin family protein
LTDGRRTTWSNARWAATRCTRNCREADMRVQVLTLSAGQCVPWHYHNAITDSFVALRARWW